MSVGVNDRGSLKKRIREIVAEQLNEKMQVDDEELYDMIDNGIQEAAKGDYLPLNEKILLRSRIID